MTLDQLKPGNHCRIIGLSTPRQARKPGQAGQRNQWGQSGQLAQRLMDMGLFPGLNLIVLRNAPLEDPIQVEVDGYSISLRHEEARFVKVAPHGGK